MLLFRLLEKRLINYYRVKICTCRTMPFSFQKVQFEFLNGSIRHFAAMGQLLRVLLLLCSSSFFDCLFCAGGRLLTFPRNVFAACLWL